MTLTFRLVAKQHAFELGAVAIGGILLGLAAALVALRLASIEIPASCLSSGGPPSGGCSETLGAFYAINEEEAGKVLAGMAVLPFALGVVAGVPIVARELELGTLQTSWWLAGSRMRWLLHKIIPVLVVVVAATAFAAAAASYLESLRRVVSASMIQDLTLHGPPVVARAFGAFGLGLLVGAITGRTLPSVLITGALSLALVAVLGLARDQWMFDRREFIDDAGWHGVGYGIAYVSPDGQRLDESAAFSLVPTGVNDPYAWFAENGYREIEVGIRDDVAVRWIWYDMLAFGTAGAVALVLGALVIIRRRPM